MQPGSAFWPVTSLQHWNRATRLWGYRPVFTGLSGVLVDKRFPVDSRKAPHRFAEAGGVAVRSDAHEKNLKKSYLEWLLLMLPFRTL